MLKPRSPQASFYGGFLYDKIVLTTVLWPRLVPAQAVQFLRWYSAHNQLL